MPSREIPNQKTMAEAVDRETGEVIAKIIVDTSDLSGEFWAGSNSLTDQQRSQVEIRLRSEFIRLGHTKPEQGDFIDIRWSYF